MANEEHVTLLKQGLNAWNAWRDKNHNIRPNLGGADLIQADLGAADLRGANLSRANLSRANLFGAHLGEADLLAANLSEANLSGATLIHTNFTDLTGCRIFGISAWRLKLDRAKQQNLIITLPNEPEITVDNIEVAQFIYLLLNNPKIREVIDTIGKKGVLLLGRFTKGRMVVLERLREELRKRDFLPIIFNFDKPETKNFTETVRLLAGMSRFVIVDITNPRLRGANLSRANLSRAHLGEADLLAANLSEANLSGATLIHTNFTDLTGCRIFGISAWRLKLDRAKQQNLIITLPNEPEITVEPDVRASHPALWIDLSEWQQQLP